MLNYLKAFLYFLLWAAIALTSHYYITHQYFENLNSSTNYSYKEINTTNSDSFTHFTVKNNTKIVYKADKGFTIYKNSEKVLSADSIANLVDSLSIFLAHNYNKQLEITGKFSSSENSIMGSLRATYLKKELIQKGFAPYSIKTSKKSEDFNFNKNNYFTNGIELKFTNLNKNTLDSLDYIISNKRLYIFIDNDSVSVNPELFKYTQLLKQYLEVNFDKTIEITGHTNNNGYFENNLIIGKNKANKLKEYFIENGITKIPINTFSRGEAEPIANKNTEEGKALNSRIEIKIK